MYGLPRAVAIQCTGDVTKGVLPGVRAGGFNVFGELRSQPSRLGPEAAIDPAVGQLVAAGLASAATLLCASLLRSAFKCARSAAAFFTHC